MYLFLFLFYCLLFFINISGIIDNLYHFDLHLLEWINHNRIKPLDDFFIFVTNTSFIIAYGIPVFLLIYSIRKHLFGLKRKSWLILISLGINTVVIEIIKHVVNRQRPFKVDSFIEKLSGGGNASFPSGHTADAFLIVAAITILFPKQKLWLLLIWIWAFMVAYTRIALGVHYPSDVAGSIVISSGIAIMVNRFFIKRNFLKDERVS